MPFTLIIPFTVIKCTSKKQVDFFFGNPCNAVTAAVRTLDFTANTLMDR